MKKKIVSLLLVSAMCVGLMSGCGTDDSASASSTQDGESADGKETEVVESQWPATQATLEGYPVSEELLNFDIIALQWPNHIDYNEMEVFTNLEELSNIHIDFENLDSTSSTEKIALRFANPSELPDAIWGQMLTGDDILNYADQGLLIPLNDLIAEYAPNIQAALDESADFRKAITSPDGNIYSLGSYSDNPLTHSQISAKMYINQSWMDELALETPTSVDELYDVLVAFNEAGDINGNGLDDEIPLTMETGNITTFMAPWGVTSAVLVEDGVVSSGYLQDGFREGLIWFNQCYEAGLVDVELFTQTTSQFFAKSAGDDLTYGFFTRSADFTVVGADNAAYYEAIPALTGPAGQQISGGGTNTITNKFSITNQCEDPIALIRWADYFFTTEGTVLVNRGAENVGWELQTNEAGEEYAKYLNTTSEQTGLAPGGTAPYFAYEGSFEPSDEDLELQAIVEECYIDYVQEEYLPTNIVYTLEETEERSLYQSTIDSYAEEMIAQFITGVADIEDDEEWEAFKENLLNMNIEGMMEINQAAYDRWMSM